MNKLRRAIAVDFDNCLFDSNFPEVGVPYWPVIERALEEQKKGAALVLWTCREGEPLTKAVEACHEVGLEFDAINENLPERVECCGAPCRKVWADEYWDDRAVRMEATPVNPEKRVYMGYSPKEIANQINDDLSSHGDWAPFSIKPLPRTVPDLLQGVSVVYSIHSRGLNDG